jgi:hypothetical protein
MISVDMVMHSYLNAQNIVDALSPPLGDPRRLLILTLGQILPCPYTGRMIEIPMSETQFAAATQRLRTNGIELSGTTGTLSKDGVTAKYTYAEGKLAIEILDRPFLLPLSLIEGKLRSYLEQSVAYDTNKATS